MNRALLLKQASADLRSVISDLSRVSQAEESVNLLKDRGLIKTANMNDVIQNFSQLPEEAIKLATQQVIDLTSGEKTANDGFRNISYENNSEVQSVSSDNEKYRAYRETLMSI